MGRRKISISPIKDERTRHITFMKRKQGLLKKAYELGVLCSCEVALIVFTPTKKVVQFSNTNMEKLLLRYTEQSQLATETYTSANFTGDKFIKDTSDDDTNSQDRKANPSKITFQVYNENGFVEESSSTYETSQPPSSATSLPTPPESFSLEEPHFSQNSTSSHHQFSPQNNLPQMPYQNAMWPGVELSPAPSMVSDPHHSSTSSSSCSNVSYSSSLPNHMDNLSSDRGFNQNFDSAKFRSNSQGNNAMMFQNGSYPSEPVERRFRQSSHPPMNNNYPYMNNNFQPSEQIYPQGRYRLSSSPPNFSHSNNFGYPMNNLQRSYSYME